MTAHNYTPFSTYGPLLSPGSHLQRQAPVRTDLFPDVDLVESNTVTREYYRFFPEVAGDPPLITGYTCDLSRTQVVTTGEMVISLPPSALDVPTTVDGDDVLAVALYLFLKLTFDGFGTGVPQGFSADPEAPCGMAETTPAENPGPSTYDILVDDTLVIDYDGDQQEVGPGRYGSFFGSLPLPTAVDHKLFPNIGSSRDPFELIPGLPSPFSWLFHSDWVTGESLPEEISIDAVFERMRLSSLGIDGRDEAIPGWTAVYTSLTSVECYVDVYPYIEVGSSPANLMMVV